jgi:transposase
VIEQTGARVHFLPPYSPDFNPIEKMWSKVKESLRSAKARTELTLWAPSPKPCGRLRLAMHAIGLLHAAISLFNTL